MGLLAALLPVFAQEADMVSLFRSKGLLFFALGLAIVVLAAVRASAAAAGPAAPTALKCEYLVDPLGIDVREPRLFWTPIHPERGQKQTAYQVLVSRDPACAKGEIWDSGKVASAEFIQIPYRGKPLESDTTYSWKVRTWDAAGTAGPYSATAKFSTGLLSASDWKAKWIGGGNELRKEFDAPDPVARAFVYMSGIGYSELRLNGEKVGTSVLDPAWTTYDKRVLTTAYDVTSLIRKGRNALAVMLGEGWFKDRALILQLHLQWAGGRTSVIASDESWKAAQGPIVEDSVYHGETYDARLETDGWDRPGFDDKAWKKAAAVPGAKGTLSAQMMPPIRIMDTIVPLKMTNPEPGVYVFDMGQNASGWARLRVAGPRGAAVRMRFAELLYDDGMINRENLRSARAEDVYILKGEGEEVYEPRFTYHGFRYVEVTGLPGAPNAETIRGRVVYSGVKQTGTFAASKPILNALQRIITWGQKTNLHSIPTDCSQRDERMGWMGDAQGTAEEAIMNFDMAAFYTNFVRDIRDAQDEAGTITDTVPHIWGSRPADPAWGTAYPLLCWYMYRYYGDRRVLEENYAGLKKYVDFLRSKAEKGVLKYSYYGDWVAVDKTPGSLVSDFYYYYDMRILSDIAAVLGNSKDAAESAKRAEEIKTAFHAEFFDPRTGNYANGTQTANALALFLELGPDGARGSAWGNLFDNVVYKNDSHLTTGIIGTKYIMEVLTRQGNTDLAYDIACRTSYPSWGYMIENGATTLWELWQKREGPSMNSHNHPMFGSVGSWLYKALAGIDLDPSAAGYEKIRIEPGMVRDLTAASGVLETVRGRVASSWSRTSDTARLDVVVPLGSEAEVVLPKFKLRDVVLKEGGAILWAKNKAAAKISGILECKETASAVVLRIGSGSYAFEMSGR
jgi:alpha-L-rhamnosidase